MGDEKRQHPRYHAGLKAKIKGVSLATKDVSVTGMQLACLGMIYDLVASHLNTPPVTVELSLPGEQNVRVDCSLAYLSDYGDEYLIGLQFEDFKDDGQRSFAEFMAKLSKSEP